MQDKELIHIQNEIIFAAQEKAIETGEGDLIKAYEELTARLQVKEVMQ